VGSSDPFNEVVPNDYYSGGQVRHSKTGGPPMSFYLLERYDHYAIVNDDARFIVGRVYPTRGKNGSYKITSNLASPFEESDEIGIVTALSDVIPTFIDHHGRNPLRWHSVGQAVYRKDTMFVVLRVQQDQAGNWLAYRDEYPLLRDGRPAQFASCAEAQRAADAHELDLFPNTSVIKDGLSWEPDPEIDWRSVSYSAEAHAGASSDGIHWFAWP
jgi:hypothetical protein